MVKTRLVKIICVASCLMAWALHAREVAITLLYTADMHGHIAAVPSERESEPGGGLLRCATLIRKIREQEPNVLLIDGGDLFQGSAESFITQGQIMFDAVKALRYDALIVGNHEFDWGIANLRALYRQVDLSGAKQDIPVLAGNILSSRANESVGFKVQPFMVRELDGVRLVVVGLANPLTARWIRPRLLDNLTFEKSVVTLRRIMPAVREQRPDILVLAVHQGYRKWGDDPANELNTIARNFPEFDVILGSHTHEAVEGIEINGVAIIQPGAYGLWLAKVRLLMDTDRHRLKRRQTELMAVDSSITPDPDLAKPLAETLKKSNAYLNQDIGWAACDHLAESRFPGQSQVQMLIARAIAEATGAEAVFHGALTAETLFRGRITMRDVWRIVPYENTIGVAHLTLDELREVLEENCRFLKTPNFRGVYGIIYEINRKGPRGRQVRNIRLTDGRRLKEDDRIKVAFNSYDLASAGDRFSRLREIVDRPSSSLEETAVDTRDAVVAYIRQHRPLEEQAVEGARIVAR